jgi:hypothetical protein
LWTTISHFRVKSHENKEKHLFDFDLGILQIQIQLLYIGNPKIGSPYWTLAG